uniref:Relaxin-like protein isoform 4 RLP4 n=1 Tax=Desmognathus ocoee TaxID=179530 RepID=A0A0H4A7J6_9SALA|nr:relaxin-like protein isoform 4 RLP4 [Desmognathus ocoee]
MRASLLCFFALCLLIEHSQVKGDEETVTLCGRDFVRAVVDACGSSRWGRRPLKETSFVYSVRKRDASDSLNINFQEAEGNEDLKDTESGGSLRKRREAIDRDNRQMGHCCRVECTKAILHTFC